MRTMSAPASASIIPANGLGPIPASSMMRTPSSGPLIGRTRRSWLAPTHIADDWREGMAGWWSLVVTLVK